MAIRKKPARKKRSVTSSMFERFKSKYGSRKSKARPAKEGSINTRSATKRSQPETSTKRKPPTKGKTRGEMQGSGVAGYGTPSPGRTRPTKGKTRGEMQGSGVAGYGTPSPGRTRPTKTRKGGTAATSTTGPRPPQPQRMYVCNGKKQSTPCTKKPTTSTTDPRKGGVGKPIRCGGMRGGKASPSSGTRKAIRR